MAPPYRIWYQRPQFWEEHGFKGEGDPRFRELIGRYSEEVLLNHPQDIFNPPPAEQALSPAPPPFHRCAGPDAVSTYTAVSNSTAPMSMDNSEPDPTARSSSKQERVTYCERCKRETPEFGDVVMLEAPLEFMERHDSDAVLIIKVWHKACFEQAFHIKLPPFENISASPVNRPVTRRIIIKSDKEHDTNAVQ